MTDRDGIFAGDDPFQIARNWLEEAGKTEPNDPNAMALATVDASGLPNVRIVLLKEIEGRGDSGAFVFYTNYESVKAVEIEETGTAAVVLHWKSLRRQIRLRGDVSRIDSAQSDAYYHSRPLESRIGAWASAQSRPLQGHDVLAAEVERLKHTLGLNPPRPPHWGGYRITPREIEFWSDGAFRLHDRFRWVNKKYARETSILNADLENSTGSLWQISRLSP